MLFVLNMEGALYLCTVTHTSFISVCVFICFVSFHCPKNVISLHLLHVGSWSHLHPFSPEEPHQVSAGGCFILRGCYLRWRPHYTMDLYVSSSEPHHRDMAAGGVHEHNRGLQQQGAGLQQWLLEPVGPAAAGCWILRGHCHRSRRKQQRCWVCPEGER